MPYQKTAHALLAQYFGFDAFRPLQEEIIRSLISGEDVLALMPTGGGKSLCYQIPALLKKGITIVVSPLIALMEDQVLNLKELGIEAAFYNSSLTPLEAKNLLYRLHQHQIKILFLAPERLLMASFLERLKTFEIGLIAIDEAHCISQWGHDFRKEYRALGILKKSFPHVPLVALTATADKLTQKDIIEKLGFTPKVYIASFNRPNIHYQILEKENPLKQILSVLQFEKENTGIIYCATRHQVDTLSEKLIAKGIAARGYHAGLSPETRREVLQLFRHDKIQVVVATIAFGMGIDKPNVRFVIHYSLPKSIESYYQETGRAGRDGLPAKAIMLYDPQDAWIYKGFIEKLTQIQQQQVEKGKLNQMLAFAESAACRRKILLNYFDEPYDNSCGACDSCDNPLRTEDVTLEAQKFLSCIYRLNQNFGLNHVIEVLRASQSKKIIMHEHHQVSTYGIGKDQSSAFWKKLAWALIHQDYCAPDMENFQVLKLKPKALSVLKGEIQVWLALRALPHTQANPNLTEEIDKENPLFQALRKLRRRLAEEEEKPPFMIFSDITLNEMVASEPKSLEALKKINGVGTFKLEKYGSKFLEVIRKTALTT